MPLTYVVGLCKTHLLMKEHAGSREGDTSKINYKTLNETSNFRIQRFLDNKQGMSSYITDPYNIWSSDTKTYI